MFQEYIPSHATNTNSLVLQIRHTIDIIPVATRDNRPPQRVIHPVANNLVPPLGGVLRLCLSSKTSNPALGQTNGDIDFIAAQRRDHMARARREWRQGDLVWEGGHGRRSQSQVKRSQIVLYDRVEITC